MYVPSVLRRTYTAEKLSTAYAADDKQNYKRTLSSLTLPRIPDSSSYCFGVPSTAHWKPDSSRSSCQDCGESFTLFVRRHHCRKCGDLFCDKDSSYNIRVDQACQFHLLGQKVKACNDCYLKYVDFVDNADVQPTNDQFNDQTAFEYNYSSTSSTTSSEDQYFRHTLSSDTLNGTRSPQMMLSGNSAANDSNATLTGIPDNSLHKQSTAKPAAAAAFEAASSQQVFGSVPANWSWSTF